MGYGVRVSLSTTYEAVHQRIAAKRGKARAQRCAECGAPARSWAYDHSDPEELRQEYKGIVVAYSLDLERYQPLCDSCHTRRDNPEKVARCRNGHPRTPENVYEPPSRPGEKQCRPCIRAASLAYYHRQRAKATA